MGLQREILGVRGIEREREGDRCEDRCLEREILETRGWERERELERLRIGL